MTWLAQIVVTLIARFKAMGFLEWAGIASLIDTVLTYNVKQEAFRIIVDEVAKRSGLHLNQEDPFSEASLAGAVSEKIGFPIRSLKNREMIVEDVGAAAAAMISEKAGFQITSITDVDVLRGDLIRIGAAKLSQDLGIPAGVIAADGGVWDRDAIKARLLAWARAEIALDMQARFAEKANDLIASYNLEAIAAAMNSKLEAQGSARRVTPQQLAFAFANEIALDAVGEYGQIAEAVSRRTRRQEQVRRAQERFRRLHGNRQQYVRLENTP